jgi:hypothetical protein
MRMLALLLGFLIVTIALIMKGDVTLNGKVGIFSFFFQAKDRKAKEIGLPQTRNKIT